jgi:imidazolonepropionase-like amidohydrolase
MQHIFTDATLIDVKKGNVTPGVSFVVENGRFLDITTRKIAGKHLSLNGGFVIPGLIDAHVHLVWEGQTDPAHDMLNESLLKTAYRAARSARANLAGGITTVRDVGAPHNISIELARAIDQEILPGCRIVAAGAGIAQTGGHGYYMCREADGPDEVRKAVREQIKAGVDLIKLMGSGGAYTQGESIHSMQLSREEISVAVQTAQAAGKKVAIHALPDLAICIALEAGVHTVEHAALVSEEGLELFQRTKAFMVPTLSPYYLMAVQGDENGVPDYAVAKSKQVMECYTTSLKNAFSRGIRLALGTDAGSPQIPHPTVPYEAWLWQHTAGIDPLTIIRAATIGGASALGEETRLGQIKEGFYADFVVYDQNPLDDIATLHYPKSVFKAGQKAAGASEIWSVPLITT